MLAIILYLFRFVRLLGSGHQAVAVENLALRLQLAAYKRKRRRAYTGAMGSVVLGRPVPGLEWLAPRPDFCSARYGCALATRTFPPNSQDPKVLAEEDPLLLAKSAD
jgi:hypothetical protein